MSGSAAVTSTPALAISPDGEHLAFICWDHPRMPWNGTELRVARLADGSSWTVRGDPPSRCSPRSGATTRHLYLISDWSGWWNLYQVAIGGRRRALYPVEEEFAGPLWQLGALPYAVLADGRLAVLHGQGDLRLGVFDPGSGVLTDLDVPLTAGIRSCRPTALPGRDRVRPARRRGDRPGGSTP